MGQIVRWGWEMGLPERDPLELLTDRERTLESVRAVYAVKTALAVHEARCDERWSNIHERWESLEHRLVEHQKDVSFRGAGIYDKMDELNAGMTKKVEGIEDQMFRISVGVSAAVIGIVITLVLFIVTHKWT